MRTQNSNINNSLQSSYVKGIQMPLVQNQFTLYDAKKPQPNPQMNIQQPQIEVTQMKIQQNQFPFVLPNNNNIANSQQIVQGMPILTNPLADLEREGTNADSYGDNLRLQKYELEKLINNNLVGFIRHNKISMVFMIVLIISYIIQIATQGKESKSSKSSKPPSDSDDDSNNLSNNVYYFILDYLFWFCACIAAIKSKSSFSLKYINIYLGLMIFSFIPQVLGYADLAFRNNKNGEVAVMVVNILACILEFLYKCFFGIIKAYSIRALFAKHTSQYQGQQVLLYNKSPNSYRG